MYITLDTYPVNHGYEYMTDEWESKLLLFTVPSTWLRNVLKEDDIESIDEFLDEYTWDDTEAIYDRALAEHAIVNEQLVERRI